MTQGSLGVLIIVDLLVRLAVPAVPAVDALVQVAAAVRGAALQQVVLQLVFPVKNDKIKGLRVYLFPHD